MLVVKSNKINSNTCDCKRLSYSLQFTGFKKYKFNLGSLAPHVQYCNVTCNVILYLVLFCDPIKIPVCFFRDPIKFCIFHKPKKITFGQNFSKGKSGGEPLIIKLWISEKPYPLCRSQLLTEHIDRGREETHMKIKKRQSVIQYKNLDLHITTIYT